MEPHSPLETCAQCGGLVYPDDRYCGSCGDLVEIYGSTRSFSNDETGNSKLLAENHGWPITGDFAEISDIAESSNTFDTWRSEDELSDEQVLAFEYIETQGSNCFVTGVAGTGKSHLLHFLTKNTMRACAVVAPTGVAALNARGQTINSFFHFPMGFLDPDELNSEKLGYSLKGILRNLQILVIDEVSMVRADMFECIDRTCRLARESDRPFGGIQVVAFGDPFQLPPVVPDRELHAYFADHWGGPYFFNAPAWTTGDFVLIELSTNYRQRDPEFVRILNRVREGLASSSDLVRLNSRVAARDAIIPGRTIILTSTNAAVTEINTRRLREIPGKHATYIAEISGEIDRNNFPCESELILKAGAQVILVKNDAERRWLNGFFGVVRSIEEDEVRVEIQGTDYSVSRQTWQKIRYRYNRRTRRIEQECVGTFTQFPVRLGWAITVHKSQGSTFDSVVLDLRDGMFAHGQAYVALSRCRTLEGMYLNSNLYSDYIIVDPLIPRFMKNLRGQVPSI